MKSSPLLGERHNEILNDLFARFEMIKRGEDCEKFIILSSPPGYGKSRIIQEFYARLADQQPEPAYWPSFEEWPQFRESEFDTADPNPSFINPFAPTTSPSSVRKELGPRVTDGFLWRAGALPKFSWWYLNCAVGHNDEALNLIDDLKVQLHAHLPALTLQYINTTGLIERLKAIKDKWAQDLAIALAEEGIQAIASGLVEQGVELLPGSSWIGNFWIDPQTALSSIGVPFAWLAGFVTTKKLENHENSLHKYRCELKDDTEARHDKAETIGQRIAADLSNLTNESLPLVLVVEDIHLSGKETQELIKTLRDSGKQVLIIGTTWPEALTRNDRLGWLDEATVGTHLIEVPALGEEDLIKTVEEYAPKTDIQIKKRLAQHFNNQLLIKEYLGGKACQLKIRDGDGALQLSDATLNSLPRKRFSLLEDQFKQLDRSIQQALIVAVATRQLDLPSPDDSLPIDFAIPRFVPDILRGAAQRFGKIDWLSPENMENGCNDAVKPAGWCANSGPDQWLREAVHFEVVNKRRCEDDDFQLIESDDTLLKLRSAVIEELRDRLKHLEHLTSTPGSKKYRGFLTMAEWLLAIDKEASTQDDVLKAKVAYQLALAHAENFNFETAIDLVKLSMDCAPLEYQILSNTWTFAPINRLAEWESEIGRNGAGIKRLDKLSTDLENEHGLSDANTLESLRNLANCYRRLGRTKEALTLHQKVYNQLKEQLGLDDLATLGSLNNLANCHQDLGEFEDALTKLNAAYTGYSKILGPNHLDTLTSLHNLANCYQHLGDRAQVDGKKGDAQTRYQEALNRCQEAYEKITNALGPNHPNTLKSLTSLADCHRALNDFDKALTLHQGTFDRQIQVLGADHPDTIASLHNLGVCYQHLGYRAQADGKKGDAQTHYQEALNRCQEAYDKITNALGPNHPNTLKSLTSLADCHRALNDFDKALELYQDALNRRIQVLGADHPDTFHYLNYLCYLGFNILINENELSAVLQRIHSDGEPDATDVQLTEN